MKPKRILAMLLSFVFILSLVPGNIAFADEAQGENDISGIVATNEASPPYTIEEVKAMIDNLPDASELEDMDNNELSEVHDKAQDAYDAFEALTDEQQAELTAELAKLRDVLEYMTGQTENIAADTGAKTPERKENYNNGTNSIGNCIFANGTAITIEEAPNGTRVWYMDGSTKKYVTNNEETGEDLSGWKVFVGSTDLDGMRGVNGSVTMTGGTVSYIYAGQVKGSFTGTSNITITGGTVTGEIYCNAPYGTSATADYVGTVTIFDAVGTTINTRGGGKADNVVQKNGNTWSVTGNGVIPSGVTLTVDSDATLNVTTGATLTNNGTLVNNGTMDLYGPVRGNAFTGNGTVNCYAAYIESVSSAGEISASVNGSTYSLQSGDTYLQNDKLYIWLPNGNAKVTLNGTDYYGVTESGKQTELTSNYVDMSKVTISGMPTEMGANTNITLSANLTSDTTLTPTISYELASSKTTAEGATLNGSTLYAAGAGKVTVTVKVSDGYTTKSQDFEITVKHTPVTGLSADVPASMIVNSKINLPKVLPSDASYQTITWSIISGQNDTGATVTNGMLTATKTGTFTIRATVENGTAYGTAYTKEFTVTVTAVNEDSSLDISAASITISQNSDGTLKVEYGGYGGNGYKNFNANDSIEITGTTNTNRVVVKSGSPNVVLSDCNISLSSAGSSPFEIQSGATVNLTLSGTNTLRGAGSTNDVSNKAPGISVPSGATVKIGGIGVLYATGGMYSAGIGGGVNQSVGTIIINGGNVIAQGERQAAGIGGGYKQSGGTVTITGGTVTAIGGQNGAGIGGGYQGSGGTVKITGGNVKAQGDSSAGEIGGGYGGSGSTLTNGNGNSVSKVTFALDGITEATVVTAIEIESSTYGVNGVSTLDANKLYFYLPSGASVTSITTESGKYNCNVNNIFYKGHEYSADCDETCNRCGEIRATSTSHNYENGICKNCGEYQYEAAVWNSSENYYEISNAKQLYWFAALTNGTLTDGTQQNASANAILMEDIVVNTGVIVNGFLASDTSGFRQWTPIGDWTNNGEKPYSGTFDGNGHTVSGLYAKTGVKEFGFIGELSNSVKNLTIADSYFESSTNYIGGIIGFVSADGTGTVEKCSSVNCIIKGSRCVGGISGVCSGAKLTNCYSTSIVTASNEKCGGISGTIQGTSTIQNCYFAGQINCSKFASAITTAVRNDLANIRITDCYYDLDVNRQKGVEEDGNAGSLTKTNIEGVTTDRFKTGEIAYLLNGNKSDGVWKQTIGTDTYPNFTGKTVYQITGGYPKYTNYESCTHSYNGNGFCTTCGGYQPAKLNNGVYEISNAGQLFWFAAFVNEGNTNINGELMKDIDASSLATLGIGSKDKKYAGTFDGNEHSINIRLNGSESVALFPYVNGATIKNLTVKGYITASNKYAASLVGQAEGSVTIEKCISTVEITSTVSGDGTHGGLVGVLNSGTLNINNCGFTGKIIGSSTTSCGGFVGWSNSTTNISNSFVAATFDNTSSCNTFARNKVTLTNCYYLNKLNDVPNGATQKDKNAFNSGEVTYQLNGSKSDGVWKQTIGTDDYPNFTGLTVYSSGGKYYNNIIVTITDVTADDGTYNGSSHKGYTGTPTNADGYGGTYEVKYAGRKNTTYSSTEAPTDAGDYTVTISTDSNDTKYSGSVSLDFTISPKTVTATIADIPDQIYTGKAIEPTITAYDETTEIPSSEYSVEYSNNTNAGTAAAVTVTNNTGGNYDIKTTTQNFIIKKADAIAPTGVTAVYGQTLKDVSLSGGWTWVNSDTNVGDVGTQTHKANYEGDDNHNAASSVDVTVTVSQSGATMTASVNKSEYTYGETVKITVNGITPTGIAPIGLFSLAVPTTNQVAIWNGETQLTEPQTVTEGIMTFDVTGLDVGDYTLTAKFSGNDNMAATSCNVPVSIKQAEPNYTTPTDLTATYGDTLENVNLPTGWAWVTKTDSVGNVGTQTHKATFTPTDTKNYKSMTVDVSVEVEKATILGVQFGVAHPEAGETPQNTVEDGTGYTAEISWNTTDTTFGFNTAYTATIILTADNNHKFDDDLSVTDSLGVDDWEVSHTESGVTLTMTYIATRKAKLTGLKNEPTNKTLTAYYENFGGAVADLPTTVTYETESGDVTVNIEWACDYDYNPEVDATNAFTWSVKDGELSNYDINNIETTGGITVTNASAVSVTHTKEDKEITYNGKTYDVSQMFTKGTTTGAVSYEIVSGGTGAGTLDGATLTITKAGTIYIKMSTAADKQYAASEVTAILTIAKADSETTIDDENTTVTYGETLTLKATVGKTKTKAVDEDKVEFYLVDGESETLLGTADVVYTDADKKDAGTATLTINTTDKKLKIGDNTITAQYGGSVNLNGSDKDTIAVKLERKEIGLSWTGYESLVFDENPKSVTATATGIETVDGEIGVTVTGGTERNAGTHTATATELTGANANYYKLPEEATQAYTISPKTVTATIAAIPDQTYTGSAITPQITVYDGETEIPTDEYEVKYSKNTDKGTATVTLNNKPNGNYTVSGSTTFEILPKSIDGATVGTFTEMTYNGDEQTPTATVKIDNLTVTGVWSNVRYVGDTTTFTANDNFTGKIENQSTGMKPLPVIIGWNGTEGLVFDNTEKTISAEVSNKKGNDVINLTITGDLAGTNKGTYTATVTAVDNVNYTIENGENLEKVWVISQANDNVITGLAIEGWTYGDTANTPTATAKYGTPTFTYSTEENGGYTDTVPTNAGTYWVKATVAGTEDYATVSSDLILFTIEKAESSVTTEPTKAENLVYTGEELALITADGVAEGGTIKYSVDGENFDYDFADIPKVINAKDDYKVWYKVVGDNNHNDTTSVCIEIAVANKPINTAITLTAPVKNATPQTTIETDEYTATVEWTPEIAEGGTFAKSTEYTATITITPKTNYTVIGIGENVYTLDGATSVANEADSKVVTAVFPKTGSSSGGSTTRYTVKFNTNGGSTVTSQTVKKNGTVTEPKEPTKDGYVFDGWYSDSKFANEYDFDTTVTKNITLYAKWVEDEAQNPSDDKKDDTNDKKDDNKNDNNKNDNKDDNKPTTDNRKNPFDDVKENEWYFDDVKYANENGLMTGITNSIFAPNENITRGMLVTVLYRAEGEPAVNKSIPFADVKADMYYANAVIWAEQNGIVKGVSETEYAPDENITREQIATIIYRYAQYKGIAPTGAWAIKLNYADVADISDYAVDGVMYCTMKNIMQGKDNNMFAPKDNATRAEIAAILNRFIESNK